MKDLARFPELRFLDRHHYLPPLALAVGLFLAAGWGGLLWGFFVSTVALWHGTFAINSLAHVIGRRRYETGDGSRNSFALAVLTLGEGWHNNHHFYPASARQGFFPWELDVSFLVLRALAALRIVSELRTPPPRVLRAAIENGGTLTSLREARAPPTPPLARDQSSRRSRAPLRGPAGGPGQPHPAAPALATDI